MYNFENTLPWLIYFHLFILIGPLLLLGLAHAGHLFFEHTTEVAKRPARWMIASYHRKPARAKVKRRVTPVRRSL